MKLHKLTRGDSFKLQGDLDEEIYTYIGLSGMPNDIFSACYTSGGKIQYFAGYLEVDVIE